MTDKVYSGRKMRGKIIFLSDFPWTVFFQDRSVSLWQAGLISGFSIIRLAAAILKGLFFAGHYGGIFLMSHRPSLREQLLALSDRPVGEPVVSSAQKQKPPRSSPRDIRPEWLERARYGVELLKVHYPGCFHEQKGMRPLKTGIRHDLVKALGGREDIVTGDKACMVSSLSWYVNTLAYHRSVVEGAERIDLEGNMAGQVTAEEARYSSEKLQKKRGRKEAVTSSA